MTDNGSMRCGTVRCGTGCGDVGCVAMGWDTVRCDTPLRFFVLPLLFFLNGGRRDFRSRLQFVVGFDDTRIAQLLSLMVVLEVLIVVVGGVVDVVNVSAVYYYLLLCVVYFIPAKVQGFDIADVSYTWYVVFILLSL